MTSSRLAIAILLQGLDDWIPLVAIDGLARQEGWISSEDRREAVLTVLDELAEGDFIRLGTVDSKGFIPWNEPITVSIARIREIWESGLEGEWEFVAWACNTEVGDQRASEVAYPTRGGESMDNEPPGQTSCRS